MSHQPPYPQQPGLPPTRAFYPAQGQPPIQPQLGWVPPPPAPKKHPLAIVGILVGGVVVLCVGMGIVNSFSDDKSPTPAATTTHAVAAATAKHSPAALSPVEKAKPVKMPDVFGQNAAIAQNYLQELGFTNITFGSGDAADTWVVLPENWTVKKQSTRAGRSIPTDTLIVLTCTKLG